MFDFLRRSMMARILAMGAVALVTSGSQVKCTSGDTSDLEDPPAESGEGPTFTTTLLLKDAAGTVKTSFQSGEVITFELTVRNRTTGAVQLDFASGQQYDFFAFNGGTRNVAWLWSSTALFTMAATRLEFAAGESKVFAVNWAQTAARGSYEGRGAMIFDQLHDNPQAPHQLGSTLVPFTIN